MAVDFGKWKDSISPEVWEHIEGEASRGLDNRVDSVMCKISPDRSGRGIVIKMDAHGSPLHAPAIHLLEGHWQENGVVERCVRDALADADDTRRVKRDMCSPLN